MPSSIPPAMGGCLVILGMKTRRVSVSTVVFGVVGVGVVDTLLDTLPPCGRFLDHNLPTHMYT